MKSSIKNNESSLPQGAKAIEAFRAVQHPRSRNATMVVITAGDRREPVDSTSHSPLFQEANLFEILPPSWREAEGQNRVI